MDQDKFNMETRKYLKEVGVTSQRAIEHAVEAAIKAGKLKGNEALKPRMVLTVDAIGLRHEIDGEIELG